MQKMMKWETVVFRLLPLFFLLTVFVQAPACAREGKGEGMPVAASAGDRQDSCALAVRLLEEQDKKFSRELRQIKREIGALNQNLEKPGWRDAVAGIGYIFGFLGLAAFFAARRKIKSEKNG